MKKSLIKRRIKGRVRALRQIAIFREIKASKKIKALLLLILDFSA